MLINFVAIAVLAAIVAFYFGMEYADIEDHSRWGMELREQRNVSEYFSRGSGINHR